MQPPLGQWDRRWALRRVGWSGARPPCGRAVLIPGGPSARIACHLHDINAMGLPGAAHRRKGTEQDPHHTAAATRLQGTHGPPQEACMHPHAPCPLRPLRASARGIRGPRRIGEQGSSHPTHPTLGSRQQGMPCTCTVWAVRGTDSCVPAVEGSPERRTCHAHELYQPSTPCRHARSARAAPASSGRRVHHVHRCPRPQAGRRLRADRV